MADLEEGMDFVSAFKQKFASSPESIQARLKAERRAGLTAKQRERARAIPKKQINFRATEETKKLIDALAKHLDKTATDVMELAVATLARSLPGFGGKT
jgi:hypothetical protein